VSEVERTLDALSGYRTEPYRSPSGQRSPPLQVVTRTDLQSGEHYDLQIGPVIVATFYDLYLANAVAAAIDSNLPSHPTSVECALHTAVKNLLNAQAMKFLLVEVLRNARQQYEQRSTDPLEGNIFGCRKIAAVLAEELTALGHQEVR
jgi:hypothetical protein